jgi:hypothetical protein
MTTTSEITINTKDVSDLNTLNTVKKIIQYPVKILKSSGIISNKKRNNSDTSLLSASIHDEILADDDTNMTNINEKSDKLMLSLIKPRSMTQQINTRVNAHKLHNALRMRLPSLTPRAEGLRSIIGIDTLSEDQIDRNKLDASFMITSETENTDLLLILKDRIKKTFKNNLLIRVINPFVNVSMMDMFRIFAHVFILLVLSYLSSFSVYHVPILPIIVQNMIDICLIRFTNDIVL